jgi:uncharacterized membrane protein
MKSLAWTDEKVERIVGVLLQTGVAISGTVVFVGGILYLLRYGHTTPNYHIFVGESPALRSGSSVLMGALHLDGPSVIQLGLLLLIATPVIRVAFSVVGFWHQRDRIYIIITFIVLAILLYALFGGAK